MKVNLTRLEIHNIIDELEEAPNNLFNFFGYGKIIEKLKKALEKDKKENENTN